MKTSIRFFIAIGITFFMLTPFMAESFGTNQIGQELRHPLRVFNGSKDIFSDGVTRTAAVSWDDANKILIAVSVYEGTTVVYNTTSPSYSGGFLFGGRSLTVGSLYINMGTAYIGPDDYIFPVS